MKRTGFSVILAVLAFLSLAAAPAIALQYEGAIIREICIVGATRTPEELVLRQLPYRIGDRWVDGFETLTLKRLQGMDLFDPQGLRVTLEPLDPDGVRVVVRVSDPHILYNDPIEFVAMHAQELMSNSLVQTVRNPFGTGTNLTVGGRWGSNPSLSLGFDQSLAGGWVLEAAFSWSDLNLSFYPQGGAMPGYESTGYSFSVGTTRYASEHWKYSLAVGLRPSTYAEIGDPRMNQTYLSISPRVSWSGWLDAGVGYRLGLDLEGREMYHAVTGTASKDFVLGRHVIALDALGGYMTPDAPLNQRFVMGGFGSLPLRGHGAGYVGHTFWNATAEYRFNLDGNLFWGIAFVDMGRMGYYDGVEGATDFHDRQLDIGLGLAIETPLGFPVRFDIAKSMTGTDSLNWSVYFDMDF